jgi:hypothetical protein
MEHFPASWHFILLLSKYPPQHPVVKHRVSVPPLMPETKFHAHTKLRANYIWAHFNLYGFRQQTKRKKAAIWFMASDSRV